MIIFNVLMAGAIGLVISLMAFSNNSRFKATIYSLPIPITIVLIVTNITIDYSHIVGLFLLCLFLWSVFYIHEKIHTPILIADIFSASIYVVLGFLLMKLFTFGFWQTALLYVIFWLVYISRYKPINQSDSRSRIHPLIKGVIVFLIALLLLFMKNNLGGFIVTFPFLGIFAVLETKNATYTLAGEFTKNSLAVLLLFIAIRLLSTHIGFYQAIIVGWLLCISFFICLQRLRK